MRALRRTLVALLALTCLGALPGAASGISDPTGVVASPNVSLVAELPLPGAIGGRFEGDHFFVTSVSGLHVFDVSDPRRPVQIGALPLPHFENEDVDLAGDILLVSNDAAESTGILYVIDISDPTAPRLRSTFPMGGIAGVGGPGHTASCVLACRFAWITDGGGIRVVDLRNPDAPRSMGVFATPAGGGLVTHDVQVDGDGLVWVVGFGGTAAYRLPAKYDGKRLGYLVAQTDESGQSTYLDEAGLGDGDEPNDYIHHNSLRRKGARVTYVTEEDYTRPGCRGAGTFQTWKTPVNSKGIPNGTDLTILDSWRTELLADLAAPAIQCSAHYFDERGGVVAQAWYQQGVRFLDVRNPRDIRQIGYWIPPASLAWAAYFVPGDTTGRLVYALDFTHGLTVLELASTTATPTVRAPVLDAWKAPLAVTAAGLADGTAFQAACLIPL